MIVKPLDTWVNSARNQISTMEVEYFWNSRKVTIRATAYYLSYASDQRFLKAEANFRLKVHRIKISQIGLTYCRLFLSTFEKTQRRKNSNKTRQKKKNSVNFAFKTWKNRRPFFTPKLKKKPPYKKFAIFAKKNSHFFLQNSMHCRPPALTGLQKSGQKIACYWVSD